MNDNARHLNYKQIVKGLIDMAELAGVRNELTEALAGKLATPSILDEEWHPEGDIGIANKQDEHILSVNGDPEVAPYFVDAITALPDMARAIDDYLKTTADIATPDDSRRVRLGLEQALEKAGVEL